MTRFGQDIRKCLYAPEDGGIGDFCIVQGEDGWHLYYLYREFHKESLVVHPAASRGVDRYIGHAFSPDLMQWTTHRPVLEIEQDIKHENLMLWAPSVVQHEGAWYMLYTGVDHKRYQYICLARSTDLYHWERPIDRPVFNTRDTGWAPWSFPDSKECRDPWVMNYKDGYLLYYTAYESGGPFDRDSGKPVIAAAYSEDLVNWEDRGPVMKYRVWDKTVKFWCPLESTCVFERNGLYYLFWNMYEAGHFCVFWKVSENPLCFDGDVNLFSDQFVVFKILHYGSPNSHFATFTNEYFGILRLYQLDWEETIPRMHVGLPHYPE
jgi:hypothetical protein